MPMTAAQRGLRSSAFVEAAPPAPVIADRAEALARVRALLPRIAARAPMAEADRRVPAETIAELTDAGLFGVATPKAFGGSELGVGVMVEVATEIASACGSTGWVYGVLTGHNWMVALFAPETQREVFGDGRSLTGSVFRLAGRVTPEEGGYRLVGGEGRFCSGIDHSDWVVVGNAVQRGDGPPEPRFFLVPVSDVEIVDDWFTAGMRGTGSRSIRIRDAFIPERRSIRIADMQKGETPGALYLDRPGYKMPFNVAQPFSLVGAPIGMAKAALKSFADSLSKKLSAMPDEQVGEQSATFVRLAEAVADVDSASALVLENAALIDASEDPSKLAPLDRARIQRDFAYAAQKCRYAVTRIFEASGGSGIYNSSDLQRIWRDVNSATAHTAFAWDAAAAAFGRTYLGLPPSKFERR